MTADEFSAPLGQKPAKRRAQLPIAVPHVIAGALALFFALFVVWVIVGDGSFGGEPTVTVPIDLHAAKIATKPDLAAEPQTTASVPAPGQYDKPTVTAAPASPPPPNQAAPESTRTVTIIDGKTGERREVVIPAAAPRASEGDASPLPALSPRHRGNENKTRLNLKGSD